MNNSFSENGVLNFAVKCVIEQTAESNRQLVQMLPFRSSISGTGVVYLNGSWNLAFKIKDAKDPTRYRIKLHKVSKHPTIKPGIPGLGDVYLSILSGTQEETWESKKAPDAEAVGFIIEKDNKGNPMYGTIWRRIQYGKEVLYIGKYLL